MTTRDQIEGRRDARDANHSTITGIALAFLMRPCRRLADTEHVSSFSNLKQEMIGLCFIVLIAFQSSIPAFSQSTDWSQLGPGGIESKINALISAGRYGEAIPLAEQEFQNKEREFGTRSSQAIKAMISLAALHQFRRNFPRAESILVRAYDLANSTFGSVHEITLLASGQLAAVYFQTERESLAMQLLARHPRP